MEKNITYFAKTNFRGTDHVFGIKEDDRRRHTYVIGKTGMGKTNLLENMIISDIKEGRGVAVIDPHGDLAEAVLNFVPASRINDVVYFNPADTDYPIAFNVMEQVDTKYRHLVASGLIGVFKKIWADSWGPRLEYLLRNVILALLEYPGSTLLGVPRMFIDKEYRKKVVDKVTDPVVKAFWLNEFTKYSAQFTVDAISPIQNKVGQFLSSSLVRNIISQTQSTINMRDIMDNKKIFIVNLAKGKIGEDYSALLGAMLITKIQLAAMGRADIPEEERIDFYLYVDEFQNFATESFAGILSEARKYRLDLIIAHQYIGQLEEEVRDAIFGNVGTLISFRVGAADAEWLEKEFEPIFMMNDLVNLAKYDIYLKLMINGVTGDAFSATTLPPEKNIEKSNVEKIIKVSRERYSNKREVVEDKISRWSGMDDKNENNGNNKVNNEKSIKKDKEVADNRKMWDAVCEICKEQVKVPFEPDPKRPIYCKNCLVEVRKKTIEETVKTEAPIVEKKAEIRFVDNVPKIDEKEIEIEIEKVKTTVVEEKEILKADTLTIETEVKTKPIANVLKEKQHIDEKKREIILEKNISKIINAKEDDRDVDTEKEREFSMNKNIKQEENIIEEKNIQNHTIEPDRKELTENKSKNDLVLKSNDVAIEEGEIVRFDK
ncbi:type IV secretion system DNA-binding domain-containing protein [Patescibacteria group bacterium]|nr:type IV secretion system DNA-binding domain-containing protein [Patescibacteria group bacterium]